MVFYRIRRFNGYQYIEQLRAYRKNSKIYHECLQRYPLPIFKTRTELQEKEQDYTLLVDKFSKENRQGTRLFLDYWKSRHYDYAVRRAKTQHKFAQQKLAGLMLFKKTKFYKQLP